MMFRLNLPIIILPLAYLVTLCNSAAVTPFMADSHDEYRINNVEENTTGISLDLSQDIEHRVDIHYSSSTFKEIDQDILQIVGNKARLSLSCFSNKDNTSFVDWVYRGIGGAHADIRHVRNDVFLDLSSGPPVCRLECVLHKNVSVTNNTFIYTGGKNFFK